MAEAIVSSILQQLATFAIEGAKQEFRLLTGANGAIKKAQRNLEAIHALLEDAEEKQAQEHNRVKLWLNRAKEASYELEDILDEWTYNTVFQKSKPLKRKVLSFILCDSFRRLHNFVVKINNVNEELDEIAREKDKYQLVRREIRQSRRLESTSFVDVSLLHGRDEVKHEIVSTLLCGNDQNDFLTLSIMGMGGIGKTALAQLIYNDLLIYNDHQVEPHFSKIIWVCVSDFFDQYKIARAILEKLDQTSTSLESTVQGVLEKICEKIRKEKFFLVLDDIWTDRDDDWEPFKAVFRRGKSGSRVLVTTRKESAAQGMESFRVFDLKLLSNEVCWLILRQMAFSGKEMDVTFEDVGKEIAKKCKGLPLAAKTLGGLLRWKRSKDEWEKVLNSELWKLNLAQEYIFTPLLLSYYDLHPEIRRCLLYCVIFPKDYEISKYQLISYWMAQGYLSIDDNVEMDMEVVGEEYFNCLASRSLFQDFKKDNHGNISGCKMHDVVYDFIKFLVGNEILVEVDPTMLDLSSLKIRHLNVSIGPTCGFQFPVNGMEKLRTCIINTGLRRSAQNYVSKTLFKRVGYLRLFVISDWYKYNSIISLGKLIHLRYLGFRDCGFERLPETVCDLLNLQSLDVSGCIFLKQLPNGIGKLINLRYLDTVGCPSLYRYPKGIAKLTCLRNLPFVRAYFNKKWRTMTADFSFGDLENLNLLQGTVEVELDGEEGDVLDAQEAMRAKLHNKLHLQQLIVKTSSGYQRDAAEACLGALSPPLHPRISYDLFQ